MTFIKRYYNKKQIMRWLKNDHKLVDIFKPNAYIFEDDISSKVYDWYREGLTEKQILEKLEKNGQKDD